MYTQAHTRNIHTYYDVVLTTANVKDMENQLHTVNEESLKIGLKIHKGKNQMYHTY